MTELGNRLRFYKWKQAQKEDFYCGKEKRTEFLPKKEKD